MFHLDGAISLLNNCMQVVGLTLKKITDFESLVTPGFAADMFLLILAELFPQSESDSETFSQLK